ncbi:MAG: secondary thiamine-phosphate synthase enzyme YjbQ [Halanaeroarchaeum sp.]
MTDTITVETTDRVGVFDVTTAVDDEIPSAVDRGVCTVFVQHTTAGVVVNEAEDGLLEDIEELLGELVAEDAGYHHDRIDDNADAHLRSILLGSTVTVPVRDGGLDLGSWQSILLVEGDGPRSRSLSVTVVPSH